MNEHEKKIVIAAINYVLADDDAFKGIDGALLYEELATAVKDYQNSEANFFDAVRNDPTLSEADKAFWLKFESKKKGEQNEKATD